MQNIVEHEPGFSATVTLQEETATPHQLVLILIDAAIISVETARNAMVQQHVAEKGEAISKAIDILSGLMESLDMEQGGTISHNLMSLYEYMQHQLLKANLYNRVDFLNEVLKLLSEIHDGWVAIPEDDRDFA